MTFLEQINAMPAEQFDRLERNLAAFSHLKRLESSCPTDVVEPCGDQDCLTCWCDDCVRPAIACVCP